MRQRDTMASKAPHGWGPQRANRGAALILSLFVVAILAVLGSVLLFIARTESTIAVNSRVTFQAFYAAEAGVETALNNIPETGAIAQTTLGNNAVFQTGPPPPAAAAPITALGPSANPPPGFNLANFSFNAYRIDATGTVLLPRSDSQLRTQITHGTPSGGTGY